MLLDAAFRILPAEARPIGHTAITVLVKDNKKEIGAKYDDERIVGAAAGARSKARAAAAKDPAKAATLDAKLRDIDEKRDQKRVDLWVDDPNLTLPTTPIVRSKPKQHQPPAGAAGGEDGEARGASGHGGDSQMRL